MQQKTDLTSKDVAQLSAVTELMDREWAPCRYNCPVHADVRAYIELISRGQWGPAIDVIRDALPFASVCGRICHHPCEANCRRRDVDKPVAIREVKRFVSEMQGADGATVHKPASQDKARVAIVGAGPAGLAAALDLAKLGYRPTVFEKFPIAGGIPATAIPKYRLPRPVIQQDVDWICAHGVELQTGVEIGKDKSLEDIRSDGFESIVIATGLATSRMLPLAGADNKRVYGVLDFLTELAFDRNVDIGDDVLVIGGGNVAMDAARSAVRLGAKSVRAMCLESEEEMPAWDWEQEEALEEGVSFMHRRGPVEIVCDGDAITAVRTRKVLSVFDDDKRFNPAYDDSDIVDVKCDTVVLAIGQSPDYGFLTGGDVTKDDRGRMNYNSATHQTNLADVFACGEIVTAPGSVVEACASGQRAAKAVDMYLAGRDIVIDDSLPPSIDVIPAATAEKVDKVEREVVPTEAPDKRNKNFDEVDHNFDIETALRESRRCMSCGSGAEVLVDKCSACLTCLRVCPFDIPEVTDVARIDSALCQACGMCIADCPSHAIVARGWDVKALVARTADVLSEMQADKKMVAYVCGHHAPETAWSGTLEDAIAGVAEIYLPSMSRLSAAEILHAFENGAAGVIVVACEQGADRYSGATQRIAKRVGQVHELLAEIGIPAERLQLVTVANQGRAAVRGAMVQAAEIISAS